jgi:glycosyltransferase involved in cell wall biosynthesis
VETLRALEREFVPLVALPEDGPFAAELRRRNIEILVFPLGRYRSGRKSFADMMAFPPRSLYCGLHLARTIRRRNVQLVYINGPRCLVAGVFAARLTGRPSLFHLHLTMTRTADIFVAALAARYATKTVVCCEAAARALLKRNPLLDRTLQVIYNPAPKLLSGAPSSPRGFDSAPSRVDSSHPIVGMVGRITPQKGQHVLLRAVARLVNRGRDVRVILVGSPDPSCPEDSSYLRSLESSVRELGLEGKVQWPGYQDDPNPYYALLDVLVIPSTTSEGLPLVALEAMQWAIPVIGSRVGGIPEVVQEGVNGLLVPPGDEGALAESLERILSDPALRSRLGLEARASLDSRFSLETFSSSICSAVAQICGSGRRLDEPQGPEMQARV